jgi:serine protease Do
MGLRSGRSKFLFAVAALAFMFLLGTGAERMMTRGERKASADSIFPQAIAQDLTPGEDIASVVEKAVPAVVSIKAKKVTQVRQQVPSMFQDPFFRQFFGDDYFRRYNIPREQVQRFLGSGVIVSKDGYILTNNHLVKQADEVTVVLLDKREFDAKVIGTDSLTEVAVLKIDAKGLPTMQLGSSADLRLAQTVLAIGNPFGFSQTVTMGIISALGRQIGGAPNVDFIQTDAAINPGNSGGALINTRGELIGINTAIYSNTGDYAGLGFAIPVDQAKSVMDDLIQHGKVVHGYLGVQTDDITAENAEFFSLKEVRGVIVTDVPGGTPAAKAGIKVNDVIVAINGRNVDSASGLRILIGSMDPGEKADIDLFRDGKPLKLAAQLTKRPGESEVEKGKQAEEKAVPQLALLNGVGLEDLNDYYRSELQIPRDIGGIIVTEVDENSPAGDAGLARGDIVVQVNLKRIGSMNDFKNLLEGFKGDKLLLTVFRHGAYGNVVLKD